MCYILYNIYLIYQKSIKKEIAVKIFVYRIAELKIPSWRTTLYWTNDQCVRMSYSVPILKINKKKRKTRKKKKETNEKSISVRKFNIKVDSTLCKQVEVDKIARGWRCIRHRITEDRYIDDESSETLTWHGKTRCIRPWESQLLIHSGENTNAVIIALAMWGHSPDEYRYWLSVIKAAWQSCRKHRRARSFCIGNVLC